MDYILSTRVLNKPRSFLQRLTTLLAWEKKKKKEILAIYRDRFGHEKKPLIHTQTNINQRQENCKINSEKPAMVVSDGIEVNQIQEEGMFEYRLFCRN